MGFVYRGKVVDSPGVRADFPSPSGQGVERQGFSKTFSAPSLASSFVGKRGPVDSETQPG